MTKIYKDNKKLVNENNVYVEKIKLLEEQSKILSTMINTIEGNEVVVNPNLINEQCDKKLNSTEGIYEADMVILPFIEKFNGKINLK